MRVLYVHLPRFPVQRRLTETPSLRGRALALVAEVRGQREVAFVSDAAARLGARRGMTLTGATALCPELLALPFLPPEEARALGSLGEALLALGPAFQIAEPDGVWLEASAAPLFGGEEGLLARVLECCAGHGYQGRAVVASQLFTARAVARYGERERTLVIPPGGAQTALAPLSLAALEGGGAAQIAALRSLGLTTLGEVAALPAGAVVARLGAGGLGAYQLCRGEDDRVLVPARVAQVLEETVQLDWPAESVEPLLFALKTALDRTCARLAGRQRAAVRLTLRLRLDPSGERSVGLTLARPTAQTRLLLDLAKHRISDLTLENPVSALGVRVDEDCEDRGQQLSLGEGPQGDAALEVVLARLSTALGEDSLFSAELEAWHRPEGAYRARPFRPQQRPRGLLEELQPEREKAAGPVDAALLERPSRLFAQAAQLEAFVDERGVISAARVLGRSRQVTSVSGPERLCGEWWGSEPFSRDYFRVQFDGLGPAWVFRDARDGRFYLHGMFD